MMERSPAQGFDMDGEATKTSYQPAPELTRKSKRPIYYGLGLLGVVLALLCCGGVVFPLEFLFTLTFGWISFLAHNALLMRPSGEQFAIWFVCVLLLVILCQAMGTVLVASLARRQTSEAQLPPTWPFRWTVIFVVTVHAMFIGGLAVTGCAQQAYWLATSPEPWVESNFLAARRMTSSNNLKQLALATHNYHEEAACFPQSTFDPSGRPRHSWITALLPFIEQRALYDSIDQDKPWDDPAQRQAFAARIQILENPGLRIRQNENGPASSHYAANGRLVGPRGEMTFRDLKDGTSTTILYGEVTQRIPAWGDPLNWRDPAAGINQSPSGFGSPYPGGGQFVFADGSVQFLREDIDPEVLRALSTPAGGETIDPDQY